MFTFKKGISFSNIKTFERVHLVQVIKQSANSTKAERNGQESSLTVE